jgi:hypothetical protein
MNNRIVGLHSWSSLFGEDRNPLHLRGIEPRPLGRLNRDPTERPVITVAAL